MSAPASPDDLDAIRAHNSRIGLRLFALYFVVYALFVGLNTFTPNLMTWSGIAGIALSLWYGMVLIVGALILALLYLWLCRTPSAQGPQA